MTDPTFVKPLVQSTAEIEPERAFAFWRDSILCMNGVDTPGMTRVRSFAAGRLVARATHSTLLHTRSDKIGVARLAHHIRRDDPMTCRGFGRIVLIAVSRSRWVRRPARPGVTETRAAGAPRSCRTVERPRRGEGS